LRELFPSGAGRKSCPGAKFSVVAVELALANLMFMFDLSLPIEEKGEELDTNMC